MSEVKLNGSETFDVEVERLDNEWRTLQVKITTEDDEVIIDAGRFCDDASALKIMFETLAKKIEDEILKDWEDVPDYDCDGWIGCDRGDFYVSVEGADWDGDMFPARNQHGQRVMTTFPSLEIATIELAKAMVEAGCFPNCWYQNDYGNTENIEEAVRKWHDDGGTAMIPLPGKRFEPGDEVLMRWVAFDKEVSWDPVEIVRDYGDEGIIYCWPGDGEEHFAEDPSTIRTQDEHEFASYRQSLAEFYGYRAQLLNREK